MAYEIIKEFKHSFDRPSPFIRRRGRRSLAPLNVMVCCAGWGKTAYLSQLAEENEGSVCISAGAEDNSTRGMIRLFSLALPEAGITEADDAYGAVCKFAETLSADGERLLLFDNASLITDSSAQSLLALIARAASEGSFRAVFAAREIPDFLLGFVMNGRASLIGSSELRFTRPETAELAACFSENPTDIYINTLHSFSGGWCAAAAALARAGGEPAEALDRTLLSQYVSSNILSGMDSGSKEYLLMTAFISDSGGELSREVFRIPDGSARSAALVRLGIASSDGEKYPPVMRQVLSSFLPSSARKELVGRAADFYIGRKRFAEAASLFEEAGDSQAAESVLRIYGSELLSNCEFELIGYCGGIIGRLESITDPETLGVLAQYYYYKGEYDKMERAYNLADSMFGKANKFGIYRMLYKGLLRYGTSPERYRENVRNAAAAIAADELPMPFLYETERSLFERLTAQESVPERKDLLSVFRFGELKMTAGSDNKEIQCKTRRSLELIAYLLENRGRTIGREEILGAFWPEDMPANAVAMLHNMIYNLRRELSAFGLENIICYKNRNYSLDMSMIAEADSDILSACRYTEEQDTESLLNYEGAVESYWGRFLGSLDSLWASEKKEYYDRCYINACVMLSAHYRARGELEKELIFLKNALRLDPYSEQFVHDILVCCSALGKPDKAHKYYKEYSERLDADFGTRPSKWLRNKYLSCFSDE